jgi:hypothetical protein
MKTRTITLLTTAHEFVLVRPAADEKFELPHDKWLKYYYFDNRNGTRPDQSPLAWEEWPDALESHGNEMVAIRNGQLHVVAKCGYEERWLLPKEERS